MLELVLTALLTQAAVALASALTRWVHEQLLSTA